MSKPKTTNLDPIWEAWEGVGQEGSYKERRTGDGKPIVSRASKLPAIEPRGAYLKVQKYDNSKSVMLTEDMQDHIIGQKRARKLYVVLDKQRAEVLRDWITAFLKEDDADGQSLDVKNV